MKLIPPTLTKLGNSSKAVTFYLLLGIYLGRDQLGLQIEHLQWLTVGFVGWVIAQGLSDFGKGSMIEDKRAH